MVAVTAHHVKRPGRSPVPTAVRIVVGALFIGHGAQKLFGAFGDGGPEGTAQFFDSLDYRRPDLATRFAGGETGAGVLLVLGLLTPLAAAPIIGVMLNAIVAAHLPNGIWNTAGGYKYPLTLATVAAALGFTGPGVAAVDAAVGLMAGLAWGPIALLLGIGGGLAVLTWMREPPLAEAISTHPGVAGEERRDEYRDAA